jgi:NADPH:quinone reductase-like Zn-dependent oxidoreductase
MKAAVHTTYGPPEVVRIAEVPSPDPAADELLVRVRMTTVNRTDCGFRAASPFLTRFVTGLLRPRRTILGNEFVGTVVAVGADVTRFAVGDRVLGYVEGRFGAHAELLTVSETDAVTRVPEGVSDAHAAAGTEGAHYALAFLRWARVAPGQDVLVYGATGAIGSAAVQLLKHRGARVTAVCDTARVALVRGLGADRVVDHTREDFTADAQRYDAVMDAVGKRSFGECRHLLKPRGVYLSSELGRWAQNPLLALATLPGRGRRVRFPVPRYDQEMIEHLAGLLGSGAFRPVIDRHFRLDQIVQAYRYVESGQKTGNVVIDVESFSRG